MSLHLLSTLAQVATLPELCSNDEEDRSRCNSSAESGGSRDTLFSRRPQPAQAGIEKADSAHASRHSTVLYSRVWFAIFNNRSVLGRSHCTASLLPTLTPPLAPHCSPPVRSLDSPAYHPLQRVPECGLPCSCWPWPWR